MDFPFSLLWFQSNTVTVAKLKAAVTRTINMNILLVEEELGGKLEFVFVLLKKVKGNFLDPIQLFIRSKIGIFETKGQEIGIFRRLAFSAGFK